MDLLLNIVDTTRSISGRTEKPRQKLLANHELFLLWICNEVNIKLLNREFSEFLRTL
jgi:hypothetical protein